jgi:hypothetical protein
MSDLVERKCLADPAGAFVDVDGQRYYRDGVLYGIPLPEAQKIVEQPMPTLWSHTIVRYRQRQVEVEAVQLTADNAESVAIWCGGRIERAIVVGFCLTIPSFEADPFTVKPGDYILKKFNGQFEVLDAQTFAANYEAL